VTASATKPLKINLLSLSHLMGDLAPRILYLHVEP
jgi:hypothetical protein